MRVLNLFLKHQLAHRTSKSDRRLLTRILSNDKARSALRDRIQEKYPETKALGDGEFLKFLLDHSDEIIKLITTILALFA